MIIRLIALIFWVSLLPSYGQAPTGWKKRENTPTTLGKWKHSATGVEVTLLRYQKTPDIADVLNQQRMSKLMHLDPAKVAARFQLLSGHWVGLRMDLIDLREKEGPFETMVAVARQDATYVFLSHANKKHKIDLEGWDLGNNVEDVSSMDFLTTFLESNFTNVELPKLVTVDPLSQSQSDFNIVVEIEKDGSYRYGQHGGMIMDADALAKAFQSVKKVTKGTPSLEIISSHDTKYTEVARLVKLAGEAGIHQVSLSVEIDKEEKTPDDEPKTK